MFLLAPRLAFLGPLELEEGSGFIWVIHIQKRPESQGFPSPISWLILPARSQALKTTPYELDELTSSSSSNP